MVCEPCATTKFSKKGASVCSDCPAPYRPVCASVDGTRRFVNCSRNAVACYNPKLVGVANLPRRGFNAPPELLIPPHPVQSSAPSMTGSQPSPNPNDARAKPLSGRRPKSVKHPRSYYRKRPGPPMQTPPNYGPPPK